MKKNSNYLQFDTFDFLKLKIFVFIEADFFFFFSNKINNQISKDICIFLKNLENISFFFIEQKLHYMYIHYEIFETNCILDIFPTKLVLRT